MDSLYDYKRFSVLYVDDEEKSLKSFVRAFEDQFRILTATNAQDGLRLLQTHKDEIGLLMTDQRMPGEKGVWLLERARQLEPRIIRMLVTAYSDMEAAVAAVNTGAIYKYITKPWDPPALENTIKRGLEFFLVQRERDQLLQEKLSVLRNMMISDRIISLGLLAAGLSHHIRNSLTAVKTFLDLTPSKLEEEKLEIAGMRDPDFWNEYYQNVQGQIEKINNLLKDLLTASQPGSQAFPDTIQLRVVADENIGKLQPELRAKNIQVENQIPENLPQLKVDGPKFDRLFELLLKDEVATLPPGARITLSARAPENGEKQTIELVVSDNGPGLPQEALRLVFDPFVVRNDAPREYGIHLMACYFIVHHHGGRIVARSEQGKGTSFVLTLPLNPELSPPSNLSDTEFLQKAVLNQSLWDKLRMTD